MKIKTEISQICLTSFIGSVITFFLKGLNYQKIVRELSVGKHSLLKSLFSSFFNSFDYSNLNEWFGKAFVFFASLFVGCLIVVLAREYLYLLRGRRF